MPDSYRQHRNVRWNPNINPNNQRRVAPTPQNSNAFKWATLFFILTIVIIGVFLMFNHVLESKIYSPTSEKDILDFIFRKSDDTRTIGNLLIDINSFNKRVMKNEKEMEHLLQEDPYVEVVKRFIQPALDKVASIRSSTQMYEKMDRSQGGPIHFIETSLKDLESLENNELQIIREKESAALEDKLDLVFRLLNDAKDYLGGKGSFDIDTILMLKEYDIEVHPEIDPDDFDKIDFSIITFEKLIVIIDKLIWRMTEGEELSKEATKKLEEIYAKYNISSLGEGAHLIDESEEYQLESMMADLEDGFEDVKEEIQQNREYFKLLMPLQQKYINKIVENQNKLIEYENKQRKHYKQLVHDLEDDIQKVKERLNNLRYATPKRVEL